MKKTKIAYWIFTGLLCIGMLMSAIPELLHLAAATFYTKQLGYPDYLNTLLGIAKVLGIVAVLTPGFPKLKEWAYAGFCFDLVGATYSQIAIGTPAFKWIFMVIWFIPLIGSYYYHKRMKAEVAATVL